MFLGNLSGLMYDRTVKPVREPMSQTMQDHSLNASIVVLVYLT